MTITQDANRDRALRSVRRHTILNAAAQAVSGSIGGIVKDTTGAAVPGATVTVTSLERKTVDTVVSNEAGLYVKDRLLPGTYEVKAELAGFKTAVAPAVRVSVDTQTPIDFVLTIGQVSERIEVTGGSPLLKIDRADVSTNFDSKQLTELPVLDRNFTKFILLTRAQRCVAARRKRKPAGLHANDGQRPAFQRHGLSTRRDGKPRSILGIIVINPTLESIGNEDHVAELRRRVRQATAGVVSVQTKSGRNAMFGSAFEFHQNDRFQSRNRSAVPARPADRQVPAGDEPGSVRRIARGQDRREPDVLLRRLSGHTQHRRRIAAADRADDRGARRRPQRLWRQHLRPGDGRAGRAAAVCRPRDSRGPPLAAGPGAAQADSGPQRGRPRQRHEGQLRGVGLRRSTRTRSTSESTAASTT
jgi:hypothetical protein